MSRQRLIPAVLMRDLLDLTDTGIKINPDVDDDNLSIAEMTVIQDVLAKGVPDKFNYGILVKSITIPLIEPVGELKKQTDRVAEEKKEAEAEQQDLNNFVKRVKMVMTELGISYKEAESIVSTRMRDGVVDRQIYDLNLPPSVTNATVQIFPANKNQGPHKKKGKGQT